MTLTNNKLSLKKALVTWNQVKITQTEQGEHLSRQEIHSLARPGGVNQFPDLLEHLSLCPICLKIWAKAVRDNVGYVSNEKTSWRDDLVAWGVLEAAASTPIEKPFTVFSSPTRLGEFRLGIYPDHHDFRKVLLTLDVEQGMKNKVEGREVVVRGKEGKILLRGSFHGGRVADIKENIDISEFTQWTVIVAGNE